MKISVFICLLFAILLNASGQLLLKVGSARISHLSFNLSNAIPMSMQVATSPHILLGLFCYVVSVIVWIGVLSRVDVTMAYPMLSIGYIFNAIIAHYWMGESITTARISGIFFILLGVYLIAAKG